jgi:predicted transcriptional regulator
MSRRKPFELLGPTERAIMQLLWETGPQTAKQVHKHFQAMRADIAYTTILTPLQELYAKGVVTRVRHKQRHAYQAVPRAEILSTAFERQMVELGATADDRADILEALRHG